MLLATAAVTVLPAAQATISLKPLAPYRTSFATESIYFVMLDRFNNGDSSNDLGGLSGDRSITGFDPADVGYFHGGDIKGLNSKLEYIKQLGFTALWITPVVKQNTVQGSSAAYHGYWGIDFTTLDPHFGSEADFLKLVKDAHALGIKVILDIVVNHTGDIINYSSGVPATPPGLENIKKPDWLNKISNYHNIGNSGSNGATDITGDFFGLDDLATEKPEVLAGWTALWSDWIKKYQLDGFRVDTARHVDQAFWNSFIPTIIKSGKNFQLFGEIADPSPETLASYMVNQSFPSVLDFAFQSEVSLFASRSGRALSLAELFNGDDFYTTQRSNANQLVTFIGNHDMGRIGYKVESVAGWAGPEVVKKRTALATDLLYLLRGIPAQYYGDEKGLVGLGGDKEAREDMPFSANSSFTTQLLELQNVRNKYPGFVTGSQQVIAADEDFIAFSKLGGNREFLLAFNSSEVPLTKTLNISSLKSSWKQIYGRATIDKVASTSITVTIPPLSSAVFNSSSAYIGSKTIQMSDVDTYSDGNTQGWIPVRVRVSGDNFASVTFYTSIDGKSWTAAGTTDKKTYPTDQTPGGFYRIYLHPSEFGAVKELKVMAVATNAAKKVVQSKKSTTIAMRG